MLISMIDYVLKVLHIYVNKHNYIFKKNTSVNTNNLSLLNLSLLTINKLKKHK